MNNSSILLISSNETTSIAIGDALSEIEGAQISRQDTSVSQLNGAAVETASGYDIVIFATDPDNSVELSAIETLTNTRKDGTIYLALTDADLPLSKARTLTRAGVDDVLPYPAPNGEIIEQVSQWIEKRRAEVEERYSSRDTHGQLIAVQQARGGIGATTIAVNLADQLLDKRGTFKKEAFNRVVIVDLDLQFGTVGDFLDVEEQEGLLQLAVENFLPDTNWVEQSLVRLPSGLAVLAAPQQFAPLDSLQPEQVSTLIATLKTMFDYVVVDLPRALVNWIEPILTETDRLYIVMDMTVPAVRASRRLMDFVLADNSELSIELVVNREKKPMMLREHHREAAKALDASFSHWIPDDPKAARTAIDFGKPLSEVAGRSDLSKGILQLARTTLTQMPKDGSVVRV
ncbi:AAA family ATPase [Rhodobacteraceae bacterium]|nr:AAA family ATPase [Paracoccaceae bacterium]